MIVYFNGNFILAENVKVSPFDRAFLFGDGVYESLRTYGRKLYRLQDHLNRLAFSLKEIKIDFSEFNLIENICNELATKNNITSDYSVYLQISRGSGFPRTHFFNMNLKPGIFIFVKAITENTEQVNKGVSVILEKDLRWMRCDIKSTCLLPSVLASQYAKVNNAYEAVLYRDSLITEGSHTNFFGVKGSTVFTTPLSNLILDGVTRKAVIEICNRNNISVVEKNISIKDLNDYNEFFITGTMTEITPVVKIDEMRVADGLPGKLTRKIQQLFFSETRNLNEQVK